MATTKMTRKGKGETDTFARLGLTVLEANSGVAGDGPDVAKERVAM